VFDGRIAQHWVMVGLRLLDALEFIDQYFSMGVEAGLLEFDAARPAAAHAPCEVLTNRFRTAGRHFSFSMSAFTPPYPPHRPWVWLYPHLCHRVRVPPPA